MPDPLGLISPNISPLRPPSPPQPPRVGETQGPAFKDLLMQELQQVNQLQTNAQDAIEDLATGKRDDVDAVMQATVHADTAFQMLLSVRNKLMDAYEEIKQIRV